MNKVRLTRRGECWLAYGFVAGIFGAMWLASWVSYLLTGVKG